MYAEQQFNAFYMVIELGLAVEIKMDYWIDLGRNSNAAMVSSQEIERAITCLMENDSGKRKKVREMSEKSRRALMNGGSSYSSLDRLIGDIMDNMT
uniref:Glycosyltransferase n=1 Tax=Rhizophora mucronata TaxID=61149 RepID=A0A2P2JH16_RHIMU